MSETAMTCWRCSKTQPTVPGKQTFCKQCDALIIDASYMATGRVNWSNWDHLLGTVSNIALAKTIGCSDSAVANRRKRKTTIR
jgi:hypothetical protein